MVPNFWTVAVPYPFFACLKHIKSIKRTSPLIGSLKGFESGYIPPLEPLTYIIMNTKNDLLDELEEILEKNIDAVRGYTKAAEKAESPSLKRYFETKSRERQDFNRDLKAQIKASYSDFDEDGSFTGSIHRTWMDLKSIFSANDDESMLEESVRGDKAAVEEYDDVLEEESLAVGLRNLLLNQRAKIKTDLERNKTLEDIQ